MKQKRVKFQKIIYFHLNNETNYRVDHYFENHTVKFLNQFSKGFGPYATKHKNYTSAPSFAPWMIHANHGGTKFLKIQI